MAFILYKQNSYLIKETNTLAVLLYEQLIHLTQITLRPNIQLLSTRQHHTGQCKRTGGCYNELVVAFFSTGGGVNGKKSIPVDFMICL